MITPQQHQLKIQRRNTAVKIILLLVVAAVIRYGLKGIVFILMGHTTLTDHMGSMSAMLVLTGILYVLSKKTDTDLCFVPKRLSWHYILIETVFAIGIWGNYQQSMESVLLLLYSAVITPVYEELLFRGYIWNRISKVYSNRWAVYVLVTILFGLWHLVYIDSIAYRVSDGLFSIMVWKVITAVCFGIVLGAVRMKSDNCFASMLVHGALNLFAR